MIPKNRRPLLIVLPQLLLSVTVSVFAVTTGRLGGRVVDDAGAPLPGVSVVVRSPAQIGGDQRTETDGDGSFLYPLLAPGEFTVTLALDGFVTQELTGVQVRLDHLTELRVALPSARFGEEIAVVETTPVVDPEQVSLSQTFTSEYLERTAIGMAGRGFLAVFSQVPGVTQRGEWGASVLGSAEIDNAFLVDSSDTTDPYDHGYSAYLSLDVVDEIAVHFAGFEAEYGRATGGVVNLVTKSGGNRFSGSFDARYADDSFSEHRDPDALPARDQVAGVSFGGPLLRDRLWFFTSAENGQHSWGVEDRPNDSRVKQWNTLGKLTWQADPHWSLTARLIANLDNEERWNADGGRAPSTDSDFEWRSFNSHLRLQGVLSDELLFGLRASRQDNRSETRPSNGDLDTISHYNLDTGESYGGFGAKIDDDRDRREVDADLSWFHKGFLGSHELKAGFGYDTLGYDTAFCYAGSGAECTAGTEGYVFRDIVDDDGAPFPFQLRVFREAGPASFRGTQQSAYLQDNWQPRRDLTLKLGLRWDRSRLENDLGHEIADLAKLQPRLGVAWDVRGDGRNTLRASWGRFMHPSRLTVAEYVAEKNEAIEFWYSCSAFDLPDPELCAEVAAFEGLDYRTDPEGWDPAGWWLDWVVASEPSRTTPDLAPPLAEELVVGYERELFHRTSIEVSYVRKKTRDLIEDTCNGNYPTPQADAACDYAVVANLAGLRRNYEAWMLRFESRALDRFHVLASYVLSSNRGVQDENPEFSPEFDLWPEHYENRYGYLSNQSRHRVKLNGYALLPRGFSLALAGTWSSEFRWTPQNRRDVPWGTIFLEPRGSRSGPGSSTVDLQLAKEFTLGPARLSVLASIYNAFDSSAVLKVCELDSGCGDREMGEAVRWQGPRSYEVGLRVEF